MTISQKFQLQDRPAQMEPLLPAEHRIGSTHDRASDLIRKADRLGAGVLLAPRQAFGNRCWPCGPDRAESCRLQGHAERLAVAQVSALIKRGLLLTDSPYGKVRLGVPQHALRFYFPGLWP